RPARSPAALRGSVGACSKRLVSGLAGTDAHGVLEIGDEDLAVADRARRRGRDDRFDRLLDEVVGNRRLDLRLRHEVDGVFRAAVKLRVPLLATNAFDFRDRQSLDAGLAQRLTHVFELERLDDCRDPLHLLLLLPGRAPLGRPVALRSKDDAPSAAFVPWPGTLPVQ